MLTRDELLLLETIRNSASLSQAAASLRKAPSTVSHAARMLEERFDALLFDRSGYRMALTDAGRLLADEAHRIVEENERLAQRIRQVACGWERRLSIVADEILELEPLLSIVQEFDALDSGIGLRITHEVLGGVWEALRDGQADIAIGATNDPPPGAGFAWRELGHISWVFAVAPHHPLAAHTGPIPRAEMLRHRAVVVADSSRRLAPRAYGIQQGQATLALPSMRAKIIAQQQGLGIGWLPLERVRALLKAGLLVEKQTVHEREPNTLYLAWNEAADATGVRWWIDRLGTDAMRRRLLQGLQPPD